jgi:hypothetical protein
MIYDHLIMIHIQRKMLVHYTLCTEWRFSQGKVIYTCRNAGKNVFLVQYRRTDDLLLSKM